MGLSQGRDASLAPAYRGPIPIEIGVWRLRINDLCARRSALFCKKIEGGNSAVGLQAPIGSATAELTWPKASLTEAAAAEVSFCVGVTIWSNPARPSFRGAANALW